MMEQRAFSDEELVAYLDGEHDHCPARDIEQALAKDPVLTARLEALHVSKEDMQSQFAALLGAAPAMPDLDGLQTGSGKAVANDNGWQFGWRTMAAAIIVSLGLGLGGGIFFPEQPKQMGWKAYVAAYQALYSEQTLSGIQVASDVQAAQLVKVSSAIGRTINFDSLKARSELDYKRGQVLAFNGKPLVQLAFLTNDGKPMALCIIASAKTNSAISTKTMEGMSAASWVKDGYDFLLIGGDDDALIRSLADHYAASI